VGPSTPCIIDDLVNDWPAYTKWTKSYFTGELGQTPMHYHEVADADYKPDWEGGMPKMTLGDFIDRIDRGERIKHFAIAHPYYDFVTTHLTLMSDVCLESFESLLPVSRFWGLDRLDFRFWPWVPPYPPEMFIAGPRTLSPGHYTAIHFIGASGAVKMFPYVPETSMQLWAVSHLDFSKPFDAGQLEEFPALKSLKGWSVSLMPGQMLFLPSRTWHFFKYEETSMSFVARYRSLASDKCDQHRTKTQTREKHCVFQRVVFLTEPCFQKADKDGLPRVSGLWLFKAFLCGPNVSPVFLDSGDSPATAAGLHFVNTKTISKRARMKRLITAVLILACNTLSEHSEARELRPDRRFNEWDRNKDGQLTREEVPERNRKHFERVDTNSDGVISLGEHLDFVREIVSGNRTQQTPVFQDIKIERDLAYADTDNPCQTLDLALPKTRTSEGPLPVIAYIHGGGWHQGSKEGGLNRLTTYLRTGRYAGVSIGYRLSQEKKWPAQLHDCKAAIRWIKANSKHYGLDPDRIAVYGTSAGGHLVAMLGLTGNNQELEGTVGPHNHLSGSVAAVLDYFGPTQLLLMNSKPGRLDHDAPDSPESQLVGGAIQTNRQKALHASPMSYLSKQTCPFLIVHGTKDMVVPCHQSEILDQALDDLGVESIFVRVANAGHGVRGLWLEQKGLAFLDRCFWNRQVDLTDETVRYSDVRTFRRKPDTRQTP